MNNQNEQYEMPAILNGPRTSDIPEPHFVWPKITQDTRDAVLAQLNESISIYDRSGIFSKFETKFANYHQKKYGLLHNSGTSAILAMYMGLNLGPDDEVICPSYTFHATVTPLMFTGAKPVFCDCKDDGNIDPSKIESLITDKTKAIIVTHMWGIPCDMNAIMAIAKKYNLKCLEDCSHAHGAEVYGKKVGTFGDAAAWSLQGQKTVSGGEGGILLTDDEEIYTRALLVGHYNKRCKQEIRKDHQYYQYFQTGFGLKLRAHPLAIAIANEQFDHLDEWLQQRGEYAQYMIDNFKKFDFLSVPNITDRKPSWYAFVMQFRPELAHGLSVDAFHRALLAEGLNEVDRPGSTGHIHDMPLFENPNEVFPNLYKSKPKQSEDAFPNAVRYTQNAIKLPVWAHNEDWSIVETYVKGIKKISNNVRILSQSLLHE